VTSLNFQNSQILMQNYLLSRRTTECVHFPGNYILASLPYCCVFVERKPSTVFWDVLCGTDGTFHGSQRAQASLGTTANGKAMPHSERELGADWCEQASVLASRVHVYRTPLTIDTHHDSSRVGCRLFGVHRSPHMLPNFCPMFR
jgi:hypothetical protein